MSLHEFSEALYATPASTWIRETAGFIPTTQSLHILAIAVVVGSALVMELRLAGMLATEEAPQTVVRRYLPWLWSAVAVLVATGTLLVVGEPNRVLANTLFWAKMVLVLIAVVLTLLFRYPILRQQNPTVQARATAFARPIALLALVIWIAVIVCGRWIAYAI